MKDRKLAVRYARALLSVLPDAHEAQLADRFLMSLGEAMRQSREIRDRLLDPAVSTSGRMKILNALSDRALAPTRLRNFLNTLVDNNRLAALPSIAEVFHEEREKAAGIVSAEMTTAAPLPDDLERRAHQALEKLTGSRVRLTCHVDRDLLGGAVTKIGSTVYDGSLRTQLTRLRRKMTQE